MTSRTTRTIIQQYRIIIHQNNSNSNKNSNNNNINESNTSIGEKYYDITCFNLTFSRAKTLTLK